MTSVQRRGKGEFTDRDQETSEEKTTSPSARRTTSHGSALTWISSFVLAGIIFFIYRSARIPMITTGRNRDAFDKPNIILIVADDMGYGDLKSYGHPTQEQGFIDEMAAQGLRFTNGLVGETICSPSRAAILTGRLPVRTGVYGHNRDARIFYPWTTTGLPKTELTIAEVLKQADYKTGMVGKWHLGINEKTNSDGAHLPYHHGFDFVGHNHPLSHAWQCDDTGLQLDFPFPSFCYLYYNDTIVSQPYKSAGTTKLFVDDSLEFMRDSQDDPFFLFFSLPQMHASMLSNPDFACSSRRGRYGDNMKEMHWAVGEIIHELKRLDIDDNTLVFYISDHGPHLELCQEGGDSGIFRGGKFHNWEGGHRVPYIVYWPGTVKPGVSDELVTAMDIISTAADLAGTTLPDDRAYDGKSIRDVILDGGTSPHESFFYYDMERLMAVRHGRYKAHFATQLARTKEGYGQLEGICEEGFPLTFYNELDFATEHDPPLLFDLFKDPGEAYPLNVAYHSDVIRGIMRVVAEHKANMIKAPSLLDQRDDSVIPCCNKSTNCICNYVHDTHIPPCYEHLAELSNRNRERKKSLTDKYVRH